MPDSLQDYWEALERLVKNTPKNTDGGRKITLNLVAREAGRKEGSIKKSRSSFAPLIKAIEKASSELRPLTSSQKRNRVRAEKEKYKEKINTLRNRDVMLIQRLAELERYIEKLEKQLKVFENVVTIV